MENLLSRLDTNQAQKLAFSSYDLYQDDLQSRSAWEDKNATYLNLYHQQERPKNLPWMGASEESIPILTESVNQFQARAYKAFFPSRSFLQALPVNSNSIADEERATRVGKYINTELGIKNPQYRIDKNMMFLATALCGSDFTKTYYDDRKGKVCIERVRAPNLVVPYTEGQKPIDDLERKTHIITISPRKAKQLFKDKFFAFEPGKTSTANEVTPAIQSAINDASGIVPGANDEMCIILEQHTYLDIQDNGKFIPVIVWIDNETKKLLRVVPRFIDDPDKPIEYFTHYQFLPNPDGFYGLGYGHLIGQLNEALNRMAREAINASTLANIGNMGGFINERLGTKGGDMEVDIGKFTKFPAVVEDIHKSIYQMQFPGANPTYVQIMEYFENITKRIANTTDPVTGSSEKVLQPLTVMTLLEQALQMPTSVMEMMSLSMEMELKKYYDLTRENFKGIVRFVNGKEEVLVTQADLGDDVRVIPVLDPKNITRQQKVARAQSVYDFAITNPLISQDKEAMYEVSRRYLQAIEEEDIDTILKPPAEVQPNRIDDQVEENRQFMMSAQERDFFDVFPDQDHKHHIMVMEDFMQSPENAPFMESMDDEQKTAFTNHYKKHMSYLYANRQRPASDMATLGGDAGAIPAPANGIRPEDLATLLSNGQGGENAGAMGGTGLSDEMGAGRGVDTRDLDALAEYFRSPEFKGNA